MAWRLLALLLAAACSREPVKLGDLACGDRCVHGWICHPEQGICVPEIRVECSDDERDHCPSTTETGDDCPAVGAFLPCRDDADDCEYGCRTCQDDYTWSECSECRAPDCPCVETGAEVCDGSDNDCDGTVDNEGAGGCTQYFADRDRDGEGAANDSRCLCAAESPYDATTSGDCDDEEPACAADCISDVDTDGIVDCLDTCIDRDGDDLGTGSGCAGPDCDDRFASCTTVCTDSDSDGTPDCAGDCVDIDGDGYGTGTTCLGPDCDDDPAGCGAACHPGATEACDGEDNDCSGTPDDVDGASGCTAYYRDHDGDGAGVTADTRCLCATEGEYDTTTPGDCDDDDDTSRPGYVEVCDGNDNDCLAGVPDDEQDGDGDGWVECAAWSDTQGDDDSIQGGDDCDVARDDIYPGAPEIFDGDDNDCDTDIDECVADCDCNSTDLVACYLFEGDASDETGNNDASASNVSYTTGVVGQAIDISSSSVVSAPDSTSLDVTNVTIEVWVNADSVPGSGRVGIMDNNGQYGVFLYAGGEVRCGINCWATNVGTVSPGSWAHIACVHDGSSVTGYFNGAFGSTISCGAMTTTDTSAMTIGSNSPSGDVFDGAIDNLRVWRVPRGQSDICAVAGNCP